MTQRILFDLSVAMNKGFCGVGGEGRLIFNMLSQMRESEINGLLMSGDSGTVFTHYRHLSLNENIQQTNRFFHEAIDHDLFLKNKILLKLKMHYLYALRRQFDTFPVDAVFQDVIWRNVFHKTLAANMKEGVMSNRFHFSDMTMLHLRAASYFNYSLKLNTDGYDFAVFMEPQPVKVGAKTTKIVRFHDAIPLNESDFSGALYSQGRMNVLNQCAQDSYFVCNSEPTREVLLTLKPELESKSSVIPCIIAESYHKVNNVDVLKQVMATRLSMQLASEARIAILREEIKSITSLDYFFHLATLDPKKNQVTLIKAWEKIYFHSGGNIKLVMASNKGWMSEEVEALMRPHIESGGIIHLANVSNEDVSYLYSHALAFVFPSYIEGFGLPPLEAMQCECPVIVSDIKTHRWVYGEAALYSNPYDVDALAQQMERLANDEEQVLRQDLINKGLQQVQKYTQEMLQGQWMDLFDTLKK